MKKSWQALMVVVAMAAMTQMVLALDVTCYVRGDGSGSDAAAGASWATAFATIQKAVDQIGSGTNLTINIQASTGGQSYYVASKTMGYPAVISLQGGFTGVPDSPIQDSFSVISDTNGPIDQPGFIFLGTAADQPHTCLVSRVTFTNVTYGAYMSANAGVSRSPQFLFLSDCMISAQSHGVFMDYVFGAASPAKASIILANTTIRGGLSGIGDGIHMSDAYAWLSIGDDSSVTSAGGATVYARNYDQVSGTYSNLFKGVLGPAAGDYDVVFGGRSSIHYLPESSAFTRPIALNGGALHALAQNSGRPLGVNTTELNVAVQMKLEAVSGVSDTPMGPLAVRGGQSVLWLKGVAGGGTWTADSLTRANRSVLLLLGAGASYGYPLTGVDMFRIADAPMVNNGIADPYFLDGAGNFLKYDSAVGFMTNSPYTLTNNINSSTSSKVVLCNTAQTMTADQEAYAMFVSLRGIPSVYNLTNDATPRLLTLGSGGLSASYTGGGVPTYISPNLKFGANAEKEALVFVGHDSADASVGNGGTLILNGSLITTNGLTKSGFGALRLNGDSSSTLRGPITINGGSLQLGNSNALPPGLPATVVASTAPHRYAASPIQASYLDLYGNNLTVGALTLSDLASVVNTMNGTMSTLSLDNVVYNGYEYGATMDAPTGTTLIVNLGDVNRAFNVADGASDLDLSVEATLVGTAGLTKTGPGRMDISATNSTFTGGINIVEGILGGTCATNIGIQTVFGDVGNAIAMSRTGALLYNCSIGTVGFHGARTDVGDVTFSGGNRMCFLTSKVNVTTNVIASLSRAAGTRGALIFQGVYGGGLGGALGVSATLLASTPPPVTSGMVPPYMVLRTDAAALHAEYVNYDATLGFKPATYDKTTLLGAQSETSKVSIVSTANVTNNRSLWALKTSANITNGTPWTLTIGSGGLLFNGTAIIQPSVQFGVAGEDEAVVYVDGGANASLEPGAVCGTLAGPIITTGGLTKFGNGMLALSADNSAGFSGPVYVQTGALSVRDANALGTASGSDVVYLQSGARMDIGSSFLLERPVKGLGSITTGPNTLTIGVGGSLTPGEGEVGTMQVEDLIFQGTYNWDYNESGADLIKTVNLACSGAPTLKIKWLGAGPAVFGTYPVFSYYGDAPAIGSWTVSAPTGVVGTLSLDTANKRVLVTTKADKGGTLLLVK